MPLVISVTNFEPYFNWNPFVIEAKDQFEVGKIINNITLKRSAQNKQKLSLKDSYAEVPLPSRLSVWGLLHSTF